MNILKTKPGDLGPIWHPCSQMKDYENFKPLNITSAKGSYLTLKDGRQLIDAISSWWCKSLGHNHPHLKAALQAQLERFEHVILANTTNDAIITLSQKLTALTKNLDKVFYAGDGSCAIEIAMKMSLHAHQLQGQSKRQHFLALKNGYHGETTGALSASDLGLYRDPYRPMLLPVNFIDPVPYVSSRQDPLWHDCSAIWPTIEAQLQQYAETTTALLVEPIVQGAGGILIYSQDFLKRLRAWTKKNNIHLIADEIMTGMGRTGLPLAAQHAQIEADFICLSKGLTSGWLPFSAVLTSSAIYDLFYDDYETGKAFLHSHTYTGNALGVSVALACLEVMDNENIYQQVQQNETLLAELILETAENTQKLTNIRHIGAVVAADLIVNDQQKRAGYAVYQKAVELGALLRPLGNTIYWMPPLNSDKQTLTALQKITEQAIQATLK